MTVYQRANPENENRAWRARESIELPNGERKTIERHGKSKRAAVINLNKAIERARERYTRDKTAITDLILADLLTEKKVARGAKPKTIHNNIVLYRRHIQPFIGGLALSDVSLLDLKEIQRTLLMSEPPRYRSAELATMLLGELYKHAFKMYRTDLLEGRIRLFNLAEDLPKVNAPKVQHEVYIWSEEERSAFLAASKAKYDKTLRSMTYPLFYVMLGAGLRLGEATGIKKDALFYKNGRAYLKVKEQLQYYDSKHHHGPTKNNIVRDVPVSDDLAALLEGHIEKLELLKGRSSSFVDNGLLLPSALGTPFEPRNLRRSKTLVANELGIPDIDLHTMRKIFCTLLTKELVAKGIWSAKIVMRVMGHQSPMVAQTVYAQVIEEDYEQAVVQL